MIIACKGARHMTLGIRKRRLVARHLHKHWPPQHLGPLMNRENPPVDSMWIQEKLRIERNPQIESNIWSCSFLDVNLNNVLSFRLIYIYIESTVTLKPLAGVQGNERQRQDRPEKGKGSPFSANLRLCSLQGTCSVMCRCFICITSLSFTPCSKSLIHSLPSLL